MNLKEHRNDVLKKLGFVHIGGKKHEKWVLKSKEGKVYLTTAVSRNNKDIGYGLRNIICKQLHVTQKQYQEIAQCTMSKKNYYDHLFDTGIMN